jgi:phage terminase small subunit
MGRNAKSVALHLAEGNPNRLTKDELNRRLEAEIKLGNSDLKNIQAPDNVKADIVAYKKWLTVMKNYKDAAKNGIEIISSSDIDALAIYCITYSEYLSLIERRKRVDQIDFVSLRDDANRIKGEKRKAWNELLRLKEILNLESAINKKNDIIIKYQDRLFLNALSKVKNVPVQEKRKPDNPLEREYNI